MQAPQPVTRIPSSMFDLDLDMDSLRGTSTLAGPPQRQGGAAAPRGGGAAMQAGQRPSVPSGAAMHGPFDRTNSELSAGELEPSQLSRLLSNPIPKLIDACKPASAFEQQIAAIVKRLLATCAISAAASTSSSSPPGSPISGSVLPGSSPPHSPTPNGASSITAAAPSLVEAVATELLHHGYLVQIRDAFHDPPAASAAPAPVPFAAASAGATAAGAAAGPSGTGGDRLVRPPMVRTTSAQGGAPRDFLSNLHHRFLTVTGWQACPSADPTYLSEPLVVELRFKEHFMIQFANPAPGYESVIMAVPPIFVGTLSRLESTVDILAAEVNRAFRLQGRPLPPWRTRQAMLSKWSPEQLRGLARLLAQGSASINSGASSSVTLGPPVSAVASAVSAAPSLGSALSVGAAATPGGTVLLEQLTSAFRAGYVVEPPLSPAPPPSAEAAAAAAAAAGLVAPALPPPLSPAPSGTPPAAATAAAAAPPPPPLQQAASGGGPSGAPAPPQLLLSPTPSCSSDAPPLPGSSPPSGSALFPGAADSDQLLFQRILSGDLRAQASKGKRAPSALASALRGPAAPQPPFPDACTAAGPMPPSPHGRSSTGGGIGGLFGNSSGGGATVGASAAAATAALLHHRCSENCVQALHQRWQEPPSPAAPGVTPADSTGDVAAAAAVGAAAPVLPPTPVAYRSSTGGTVTGLSGLRAAITSVIKDHSWARIHKVKLGSQQQPQPQ